MQRVVVQTGKRNTIGTVGALLSSDHSTTLSVLGLGFGATL